MSLGSLKRNSMKNTSGTPTATRKEKTILTSILSSEKDFLLSSALEPLLFLLKNFIIPYFHRNDPQTSIF
jgi:hypothetical protein